MIRSEMRKFIRELSRNVTREALAKVPSFPEHWDGHELRRYLADKFEESSVTLKSGSRDRSYRRRFRAYRNDMLTRNI